MTNANTNTPAPIDGGAILERVRAILGTRITRQTLENAGRWLAQKALELIPGDDKGTERKQWAKSHLLAVVEQYDDLAPVVGPYLDLPFVNGLEKAAVDIAVEKGWAYLVACAGEAPVTDAPELHEGGLE